MSIRIEGETLPLENFSKYGVAVIVPADRRSFPSQFACEILMDGEVVHRSHGLFRHRRVVPDASTPALVGISLADEVPVEVLLGSISAKSLAQDVAFQVGLLRELEDSLRLTLEHVFLLFSELSLSLGRLSLAYPELSSREQHHFRLSFLETAANETSAILKIIGNTLDPIWTSTSPAQKSLFLSAMRKRLAPFFDGILEHLGKSSELPLLYPGAMDLREARSRPVYEGEDLLSSLLSTLLLASRSVDATLSLESRMAETLATECRRACGTSLKKKEAYRILFLCAGAGRLAEGYLSSYDGQTQGPLSCTFYDFLEPPLLRSQATMQKHAKVRQIELVSHYEMHITSEAARDPFEDLVLSLDLKKAEGSFDAVVCPWLADHLEPASCLALLTKLQAALKPGGMCFLGKQPPPRPLADIWPFLLDWERQTPEFGLFLASIPSGFQREQPDVERGASGQHALISLRKPATSA